VGQLEMIVLLRTRDLNESVVLDLWNIGLQNLSRLVALHLM